MASIILIDDDDLFRQVVGLTLRQRGHSVLEANDGDTGIQLAETHLPDLVLSDIVMTPKDGYAVLAALRQNPATSLIPVILMTGHGDNQKLRQGMVLGADDFLPKPFTPEELIAAVNARLQKQQALARHSDRRLATLRDNISISLPHEMLTPLQGILGAAEIILTDAEQLPGEVVEMAQQIMESGNRLHRTIQHFLIYAQTELLAANPQKLAGFTAAPPLAAEHVVAGMCGAAAKSAGRETDLELKIGPGTVGIAEDLLAKLLGELLDNAFKFSPPGTPVRVRGERLADCYRLEIRDGGCGMKPEELAQVGAFMQFQRRLVEQQGTGLGLVIARRLCELHGGSLELRSAPGAGTQAVVRLPSGESASAAAG